MHSKRPWPACLLSIVLAAALPIGAGQQPAVSELDRIGPPAIETSSPRSPGNRENPARFTPLLPALPGDPPVISVGSAPEDLGLVVRKTYRARLSIRNLGGSPLEIRRIHPRCECTWVTPSDGMAIPPGGQEEAWVNMIPGAVKSASLRKTIPIEIESNDPRDPLLKCSLPVEAIFPLRIEPSGPRLRRLRGGPPARVEIDLKPEDVMDVEILGARSRTGRLVLGLQRGSGSWKLTADWISDAGLTSSFTSEVIEVEFLALGQRFTEEIAVGLQVPDRIEASPRMVYFRRSDFKTAKDRQIPSTKEVKIQANLPEPFRFSIRGIRIDGTDPFFKAEVAPVQDGREYQMVISIENAPEPEGKVSKTLRGNVTVLTDDPQMPGIPVRILAFR